MCDWRERVPVLDDGVVTLRAPEARDVGAIVEWARDRDTLRWTTIPDPEGGYGPAEAQGFLDEIVAPGWRSGRTLTWVIEAERDGRRQACGTIDLRADGDLLGPESDRPRETSVGYVLHPAVRGRGLTVRALRLLLEHGFDTLGVSVIRWQAGVGNDASWRVAARVGFTFEGVGRRAGMLGGEPVDMWQASILAGDPREPNPHPVTPGYPQQPPVAAG